MFFVQIYAKFDKVVRKSDLNIKIKCFILILMKRQFIWNKVPGKTDGIIKKKVTRSSQELSSAPELGPKY